MFLKALRSVVVHVYLLSVIRNETRMDLPKKNLFMFNNKALQLEKKPFTQLIIRIHMCHWGYRQYKISFFAMVYYFHKKVTSTMV